MPEQQIPLTRGDKVDSNTDYRDALPVNMYAVNKDILGAAGYMLNWYGIASYSTGKGVDRGSIWVSRKEFEGHYRISGGFLVNVSVSGITTSLGEITGTGEVSLAYSFNNLAIVADGKLWYYNKILGLRQITDLDVGKPIDIAWADGYFILTDGEDIFHSDITNEESFLPLDFGNAQFLPDATNGLMINQSNELVAFGEFSTENFYNRGAENFAYQRIPQKAQKIGILSTHTKAEMNGKFYVIGRRKESAPSFHVISQGSSQTISTRETDKILALYTRSELSESTVNTMIRDNVKMVIFNLPNHTLLFNASIAETLGVGEAWTLLKSDVNGDRTYRGKGPILDPRNGKWIVGDKFSSNIGELDESICTHYDELAEWILFTPLLKMPFVIINEMEIETIPGMSPDNDATIFISQTVNGRTHGFEYTNEYGMNLDYSQRFIVRNPFGFVRNAIAIKLRGASRSRMALSSLKLRYS